MFEDFAKMDLKLIEFTILGNIGLLNGGINEGTIMNNKKELRHRCYCPHCKKVFDNRYEGFVVEGYLICAECYQKYAEFLKQRKNKNEREC